MMKMDMMIMMMMIDDDDDDGELDYIGRFPEKLNDLYKIPEDFSGTSKTPRAHFITSALPTILMGSSAKLETILCSSVFLIFINIFLKQLLG